MHVHYMSDLHLEFPQAAVPPETDVLVLAGDITVARCLDERKTDEQHRKARDRTRVFFDMARENARLGVIYIGGNHEPYGFDIDDSHAIIRETIAGDGVHYLENEVIEFDGVAFLCCTLWTDMDKRNPIAIEQVGRGLNDFHLITKGGARFHPEDAADIFDASVAWLKDELVKRREQTCIVVTHHAPSYHGIDKAHAGNPLNPGFASNLENLIAEHDNIHTWIFGHTHIRTRFEIAGTAVVSNAAGYPGDGRRGWTTDAHLKVRSHYDR